VKDDGKSDVAVVGANETLLADSWGKALKRETGAMSVKIVAVPLSSCLQPCAQAEAHSQLSGFPQMLILSSNAVIHTESGKSDDVDTSVQRMLMAT
jgi:hypothetical protein